MIFFKIGTQSRFICINRLHRDYSFPGRRFLLIILVIALLIARFIWLLFFVGGPQIVAGTCCWCAGIMRIVTTVVTMISHGGCLKREIEREWEIPGADYRLAPVMGEESVRISALPGLSL